MSGVVALCAFHPTSAQSDGKRPGREPSEARLSLAAMVALLALCMLSTSSWAADNTTASTTFSVATPAAPLPFDLPAPTVLRSSPRKAFAHYVPWMPQSVDNKTPDYYDRHFLVPDGEGGKHAAYGGYMRDRPLKRPVVADAAWKLRDLETEVRQAVAAGLDGFAVDIVQLGDVGGTQWTAINSLLQAARNVDPTFKIMLMPDMTGTNMLAKDAPTMAKYLARLGASPGAYRLADGRLVVSPFFAERKTASFWTEVMSIMKTTYGTPVAFLPLFQDERKWRDAFDPISYGMSNWGNRNPAGNNPTTTHADSPKGRIAAVHALGQTWMQPVSVQDQRPRAGIFDEAQNTQNLRKTWEIARENGAELVQLPTWNDYPEGTQISPSAENGWSYLDMSAYYLSWYKTGSAPEVVRDAVYLTHRNQPHAALPRYPQTLLMKLRGGSSPARDTVEALTFLTAPATVRVQVGTSSYSCEVSAGADTCTVPLGAGSVSATLERNSTPITTVVSPVTVTRTPYVQDLQYVASSSGRQKQNLPDTSTRTITLAPVADTMARQQTPATASGPVTSLLSDVEESAGSPTRATSYLRFTVPALAGGESIAGARLSLHVTNGTTNGPAIWRTGTTWSESTLSWNSGQPTRSGITAVGNYTGMATGRVTTPVSGITDAGDVSLQLYAEATDGVIFASRENTTTTNRPELILTVTTGA